MLKFFRLQAVHHPCSYQLSLFVLLAAAILSLTGCVKREIREDPWTSPRGSVDMKTHDNPHNNPIDEK